MDEPLGALDAEFRHLMCGELRELHDRIDATTIYVTHDQLEAMSMADRIAVMNARPDRADRNAAGDLRPAGEHVRRRLHRLAADEFLATSTAGFSRGSSTIAVRRRRALPFPRSAKSALAGALVLGVRPEHVRFSRCRAAAGPRLRRRISRHHADRHRRRPPGGRVKARLPSSAPVQTRRNGGARFRSDCSGLVRRGKPGRRFTRR